jgi:hypothetical protein
MVALASQAGATRSDEPIPIWDPAVLYFPGAFPFGLDAADAIGPPTEPGTLDGYPDIVIVAGQVSFIPADLPNSYTGLPGEIVVYQNTQNWLDPSQGLREFQRIQLPANTIPAEVIWADITGDTRLDIVVSATTHYDNQVSDPGDFGLYVFEWNDNLGKFSEDPYQYLPSTYPLRGLTAIDYDNDGDTDIIAAVDWNEPPDSGRDKLSVFTNLGGTPGAYTLDAEAQTGALGSTYEYGTAQIESGSFDKTPLYPDAFTPLYDATASLVKGSAGGPTPTQVTTPWGFMGATGIASGRFVLGKLTDDLALVTADGVLGIYRSNANLSGGDFGHNGDPNDEPNDVYLETGGGGPTIFYPNDVDAGHLNGGTKLDLVVTTNSSSGGPGGSAFLFMLLGRGDGTFQIVETSNDYRIFIDDGSGRAHYPVRVRLADLNQDGFDDVVTANHGDDALSGSMSVVLNGMTVSP